MEREPAVVGPPAPHVVESEVDGHISLYDAEGQEVLVLNETASDVWRLSDGEHTLDEIVSLLAQAYAVAPDDIRADVTETVELWRAKGLLAGTAREDRAT